MDDGLLYETAAKDTLVVTGHHFVSENCHSARLGLALKITNDHTDGKCLLNLKISGSKIRIKKKKEPWNRMNGMRYTFAGFFVTFSLF